MRGSIKSSIFILSLPLSLSLTIGNSFAQKGISANSSGNCRILTNSNYSIQGKIMWNGNCENGHANGNGIIWIRQKNQIFYVGSVLDGYMHGYGVYYGNNDHCYSGEWEYGNFLKGDIFFLEIKLTTIGWPYDTECIYGGMRLLTAGLFSKNSQEIDTSIYKVNLGIDSIYPGKKTNPNKVYFLKTKAKYIFKTRFKTIRRETLFMRGSGEYTQEYIVECNNGKIGTIIENHNDDNISWTFKHGEKLIYSSLKEAINGFCECNTQ